MAAAGPGSPAAQAQRVLPCRKGRAGEGCSAAAALVRRRAGGDRERQEAAGAGRGSHRKCWQAPQQDGAHHERPGPLDFLPPGRGATRSARSRPAAHLQLCEEPPTGRQRPKRPSAANGAFGASPSLLQPARAAWLRPGAVDNGRTSVQSADLAPVTLCSPAELAPLCRCTTSADRLAVALGSHATHRLALAS